MTSSLPPHQIFRLDFSLIKAALGRKSASATLKDMNTLILTTPALSAGPQQLVPIHSDGESVSFDAAYPAQWNCINLCTVRFILRMRPGRAASRATRFTDQ
jgi:hypothetical protein